MEQTFFITEIDNNRSEIVDAVLVNMMTGEVNTDIDVPVLSDEERREVHSFNIDI